MIKHAMRIGGITLATAALCWTVLGGTVGVGSALAIGGDGKVTTNLNVRYGPSTDTAKVGLVAGGKDDSLVLQGARRNRTRQLHLVPAAGDSERVGLGSLCGKRRAGTRLVRLGCSLLRPDDHELGQTGWPDDEGQPDWDRGGRQSRHHHLQAARPAG